MYLLKMRKLNLHIIWFVFLSFLGGSIIAPLAHQFQHGFYALSTSDSQKNTHHEHPDFDAFSDNTPHLQNTERTCVLCSFSLLGHRNKQASHSAPDASNISYNGDHVVMDEHNSLLAIRGPPATA